MAKGDFLFEINKQQMEALQNAVKGLNEIDGNRAILNSFSKGIQKITREGRANILSKGHKQSGNLLKSVKIKRVKKWMSVYGGFRKGKGGGNHAHLIDRGTAKRATKKGQNRGTVMKGGPYTGTRFWTKPVEKNGPRIIDNALTVIYKEVNRIIRRKGK